MSWVRAVLLRWLRLPRPTPVESGWEERMRVRRRQRDAEQRLARLRALAEVRERRGVG